MTTIERRAFELREEGGRRISGTAVRYGDIAVLPGGIRERFEAGAFRDAELADVVLNLQHDRGTPLARTGGGGLAVRDSREALTISAELPATRSADDALTLVKAKVLRGLSVEFTALSERFDGGIRVIERAALAAVAIVDSGAYPQSVVEARARRGSTLSATLPAGKRLDCRCAAGGDIGVQFAEYSHELMQAALDRAFETARLILTHESYAAPLASVQRGTLRRTGPLTVDADLPQGPAGDAAVAAHEAAGLIVRPLPDAATAVTEVIGDTLVYKAVDVRALIATSTDASEGWPLAQVAADAVEPRQAQPRRRLWL